MCTAEHILPFEQRGGANEHDISLPRKPSLLWNHKVFGIHPDINFGVDKDVFAFMTNLHDSIKFEFLDKELSKCCLT